MFSGPDGTLVGGLVFSGPDGTLVGGLVFSGPDATVVGGLVLVYGCLVFDSLVSGNLKWGGTFVGGELGTCS